MHKQAGGCVKKGQNTIMTGQKKRIWIFLFLAFDGLEFSHKTCSQHMKYYAITIRSEVQNQSAHPIYISSA